MLRAQPGAKGRYLASFSFSSLSFSPGCVQKLDKEVLVTVFTPLLASPAGPSSAGPGRHLASISCSLNGDNSFLRRGRGLPQARF